MGVTLWGAGKGEQRKGAPSLLIRSVRKAAAIGPSAALPYICQKERSRPVTLGAKSSSQADVFQHPTGSRPTSLYDRSNHSVSWGFNLQLIPLAGFTRKLPLFETRCAGYFMEIVLRGGQPDITVFKNARAGMTAASHGPQVGADAGRATCPQA